jgi:hypothetical protein
MRPRLWTNAKRAVSLAAATLVVAGVAHADTVSDQSAGTIGELLKSGWEVAGYSSNSDNRSTFILFKNPAQSYLVQCLAGYDVTRSPRVFQNCYRLK